ncbi:MAG TPA: hypothetical protein VD966_08670 [Pyrinomonadaceae bacterium]|nr:hypothetical protein [Pyrinomonadaceae bacterium]
MPTVLFNKMTIKALLLALVAALALSVTARAQDNRTPGGTVISNRAEATYEDAEGKSYAIVSPTVTVTVLAVSTLVVTPDETEPSAGVGPHERITRLFRICNTGNTPDLYTITRAETDAPARILNLYFDTDASGTVTDADAPVDVGVSMSPRVLPGACTGVLAVVETNDSAPQSLISIRLTARSNVVDAVNGRPEDNGTIIITVGNGPRLTSPDNPSLPPVKLVNGGSQAVVSLGVPFTYTITFRNNGDTPARGVIISDELVAELEYVANSLRLDERSLSDAEDADEGSVLDRRLVIQLSDVAPDQIVRISFKARLIGHAPAGVGIINVAALTGLNIPPATSSTTVVVIDPFGIVFAGRSGSAAPIAGARVEILLDQASETRLPIPPDAGFPPNARNENPFATDLQGRFSFALLPEQLGTESSPARYLMRVTAQGYVTRLIELIVRPTRAGLYALTARALDGQSLARAGGFELVFENIEIEDLAAVALNIPMFEPHGLEISKAADRPRAEIGDLITYRVELHNPTAAPISDVLVRDSLPDSFHYATGTARLSNGSSPEQMIEPEMQGGDLIFRIGVIGPGATARLLYRVRIGVNAREGEQGNVAIASGLFPSGERNETPPARASVNVSGGVFSTRQIILGRVFEDINRNDQFDDGDKPMPGVRLYLNSGQSVTTDSQGLYSFPSLGDGAQVISLDPVTLPQGYALADGGTVAGRSWTRLLRTPLGGGALFRQNFALINNGKSESGSSASSLKANASTTPDSLPASTASKESSLRSQGASFSQAARPQNPVEEARQISAAYALEASAAGRYEFASNETIEPVPPGEVKIITPAANAVVMSPAMQLEARVALNWTVRLEVNGKLISEKNIGTTRLDQKNNISTFTFVGIDLHPGPNQVRVTPVSPEGAAGRAEEMSVMGRGPVRRLKIASEKIEIQADGRDSALLHVRAYDQWGSPAIDAQVAIETSLGQLLRVDDQAGQLKPASQNGAQATDPLEQANRTAGQMVISLDGGKAAIRLVASGAPGEARVRALMGQTEARTEVRITPESRPTILVGLAEVTIGKAVPEVGLRGEEGRVRSRLSFFYNGRVWGQNILTLAYDSQRPINRTAGRDRLFQLDPLDRVYPLFGDSSTRYEAAQSNSKLYARLDRKRSYAMFGDFEADMDDLALSGYSRKLTGVKLHLENSQGDFVTVTGARPDTAFARDVFPGGTLSIVRLSHGEILPGSETLVLEVRDRRNPEIILSRETLVRSIDYNLNPASGELFLLRYVPTFDSVLNLVQVVITYEHRAAGMTNAVYTARARKNLAGLGLKLGLSAVVQRQADFGSFVLGGIDAEKRLPRNGSLRVSWARSQGEIMGGGNFFGFNGGEHNGDAYQVELEQPLSFYESVLRARYTSASAGFFNPFGATVTPGSSRGELSFEFKPRPASTLRLALMDERNRTETVDNSRLTLSAALDQVVNERLRFHLGYDHRSLDDDLGDLSTDSNLLTAAVEMKVTDKLQVSVKREQNLGDADPTYPNQTTIASTYQINQWTRAFFTQRLAAAPIMPIGDVSRTGFALTGSRRETAIGVETRFGKYTSMVGRYQLENGINGTDSFAVIGLQNRLPISGQLSLELGFERGFHLDGEGESFNSATIGFGWTPTQDFRASARYEFRDRGGLGGLFAIGAAGRISEAVTALSRFQWARAGFAGRTSSSLDGLAALAIRPLSTDRAGLLFSFNHRSLQQDGEGLLAPVRDRIETVATDGYYQATKALELYGRLALRFSANGQPGLPYASTLTYLAQARAQYRLTRRFDWAGEGRFLIQPSSGTQRSALGAELGFWALPDLRLGGGYNFTFAGEPAGARLIPTRRGFYFTLSSKLSNLFDLFGTSPNGLAGDEKSQQVTEGEKK